MSSTRNIIVSYFPLRGRAEAIKLLLEDNNIPYKFNGLGFGAQKSYPAAIYGQLPTYEEEWDGKKVSLVETSGILHYVAKKAGVYPFCPYESARADMFEHACTEVVEKFVGTTKFNKGTKEEMEATITKFYTAWDKLLGEHKTEYINERICYGDYCVFATTDLINEYDAKYLENYKHLKAHHEKMKSRPGIQAYFKSDRFIK